MFERRGAPALSQLQGPNHDIFTRMARRQTSPHLHLRPLDRQLVPCRHWRSSWETARGRRARGAASSGSRHAMCAGPSVDKSFRGMVQRSCGLRHLAQSPGPPEPCASGGVSMRAAAATDWVDSQRRSWTSCAAQVTKRRRATAVPHPAVNHGQGRPAAVETRRCARLEQKPE